MEMLGEIQATMSAVTGLYPESQPKVKTDD